MAAPQDSGKWSSVVNWPLIGIHTVLMPQGGVFSFGTDQSGVQGAQFFYDVWDPFQGTGSASHNTLPNTLGVDTFCSAAVLLPETGNVLMSGGDNRPNGGTNRGIKDATVFNTATGAITKAADMASARWYPTSTVLANGDVLLSGGRDGAGGSSNIPEVYSPATNSWRSLFGSSFAGYSTLYPRQWVIPDGRIFGFVNNKNMYYLNPNSNGSIQFLNKLPSTSGSPYFGTAVMYQPGKILSVGGGNNVDALIIDVNGSSPSVRSIAKPVEGGRFWADSVVLPTGEVMIVGGSGQDNRLTNTSYRPEIWNPATERWSLMDQSPTARLYHSTALLLHDGRVLVAGGGAPGPLTNTNAEIFSPPYLFNSSGGPAARPEIYSASKEAPYGAQMFVGTSGQTISRVTLIKTGAVTHSFNMEQRFIDLGFSTTNGGLQVNIPSSSNVATPGYYLLSLINDKGVPSKSHIMRIAQSAVLDDNQNAPPVANPDSVNVTSSGTVTINPLANDTGSNLTLLAPNAWSLQGGNVALNNNQLRYTPKPGFNGEDKIWYTINDSQGRNSWGEITINVSGNGGNVDVPPVGNPDSASSSGSAITIDVLANDDGSGLILSQPSAWSLQGGNVALSNNKLRYTPKSGFNGEDKIWYTFSDSQGRGSWGEVTINVSGGDNAPYPVAIAETVSTAVNTPIVIDVLSNDIGVGLRISDVNAWSANGAQIAIENNQLRYTPPGGYSGSDNFWYVISDSQNRSNAIAVTVNVGN